MGQPDTEDAGKEKGGVSGVPNRQREARRTCHVERSYPHVAEGR